MVKALFTLPVLPIECKHGQASAGKVTAGVTGFGIPDASGDYPKGFIQQWSEASSPKRPALVFAPGFLTQCNPKSPDALEEWREPCLALARDWDFAAYGVHWPSGYLRNLLLPNVNPWTMAASAIGGKFILRVITLPLLGFTGMISPVLSLAFGPSVVSALVLWKAAVKEADHIGSIAKEWPSQLRRPVLLAGHSLGGRMVLRGAENAPEGTFLGVVALAPAIEPTQVRLQKVAPAATTVPQVYASTNDTVLKWLFRAAEGTVEPALGYSGIPKPHRKKFSTWDVSTFRGEKIGHLDYNTILYPLLSGRQDWADRWAGEDELRRD